jgi:hypothetical protein
MSSDSRSRNPELIAAAQAHAILALAATTALDSDSREWFNVAGTKMSGSPITDQIKMLAYNLQLAIVCLMTRTAAPQLLHY